MITPLYLSSTITNAAAPFTVGHPFRKGSVPAGSTVIADLADFQCLPQNYWEDGSLKFAILSGKASLTANVEKTVNLDVGSAPAGTALTIADLKATSVTASIALTNAKDWTFDTASETIGSRQEMSGLLDIFEPTLSTITVDNGATVGTVTATQDAGELTVVLTAPLSGGTEDGYQTVKYRPKYRVKRNISAITQGTVTRITVDGGWKTSRGVTSDGIGTSIAKVGNTITFAGVGGMTQLNGLTGTITAVGGTPYVWVEVNIDSTGFTPFTSGGTATKNELNTATARPNRDNDDFAYVRTGGGLAWDGTECTYSPTNDTGQTSVSWATTDWDTPFEQIASGPKMSSWLYRKAITPDRHMVAWLEVRLYAGGAVQVLPYVENGMLKVICPAAKQATFAFTLNSVERFNQSVEIKAHARTVLINGTHLSYWTVTDPNVVARHNRDYIYSTRMIPTYRHITPDSASTVTSLPSTFAPFQQGSYAAAMGAGGFTSDIGLISNADALYFTNGSRRAYEAVVRNGFSAGRYRFHYRDESNNWHKPIRFSDYPNLVINGTGSGVGGTGTSTKSEFTPIEVGGTSAQFISSHHPSMGYVAHMVTGWHYFREEMQFLSTLLFLKQVDSVRGFTKGLLRPEVGANQTRGAAWARRSLVQAAALTPDSDAMATELRASLAENILFDYNKYIAVPHNPFGWYELYTDYGAGENEGIRGSGFQQDFMTATMGFIKNVDPLFTPEVRTKLAELFMWKAKSAIGRLGGAGPDEFPYTYCNDYEIPLGPNQLKAADTRPATVWDYTETTPTGPWWSGWGEVWSKLYPTTEKVDTGVIIGPLGPGSYPANLLPAIASAVEHDVPGALAAYNRLVNASNWPTQEAAFINTPVYGIQPASMTEVEAPTATTPRGAKVRVAKDEFIAGKVILGIDGFGVLAETIPEIGTDGPGLNYSGLSFPADTGKEILLEQVSAPSGSLVVDQNYGATYEGGSSSVTFNVYEEGVKLAGTSSTTFALGAGTVTLSVLPLTQSNAIGPVSVTLVPSGAAPTVTISLVSMAGVPTGEMSGLRWAWFDQPTPGSFTAPTDQGTFETADAAGNVTIDLPNTTLSSGQVGWLVITNSAGTVDAAYQSFSGPAMVD